MGKSCASFRNLDDLLYELVREVVARKPNGVSVAGYRHSSQTRDGSEECLLGYDAGTSDDRSVDKPV